jgi:hypothetical protein
LDDLLEPDRKLPQAGLEADEAPYEGVLDALPRAEAALRSVVTVGAGRGFVVEVAWDRYVITAAHCLPWFPPCAGSSGLEERTYKALVAPLGRDPSIWAECLFVDPIADIAVLGSPDDQGLFDKADAYRLLVENATPIRIGAPAETCEAYLLSLENEWFQCRADT